MSIQSEVPNMPVGFEKRFLINVMGISVRSRQVHGQAPERPDHTGAPVSRKLHGLRAERRVISSLSFIRLRAWTHHLSGRMGASCITARANRHSYEC